MQAILIIESYFECLSNEVYASNHYLKSKINQFGFNVFILSIEFCISRYF